MLFRKKKKQENTNKEVVCLKQLRQVYKRPPVEFFRTSSSDESDQNETIEKAANLKRMFNSFGIDIRFRAITPGVTTTTYEFSIPAGIKLNKITSLQKEIQMCLCATTARIIAPIPGKGTIGIEIDNEHRKTVYLGDLLRSNEYLNSVSRVSIPVGMDAYGNNVISDIAQMPHLLIAGTTGSGKSVFLNSIIMSLIFKSRPDDLQLVLIDPKHVELLPYHDIPHLLYPVVTDVNNACITLKKVVDIMQNRYDIFAAANVRDIYTYKTKTQKDMSQIVVIIDELADLMLVSPKQTEESICRLAQLARAAGIHLILATQRPTVNVVTGLIKANMPTRISFKTTSAIDSRVILDQVGAEKLLGNGDMLFCMNGQSPIRVQGPYIAEEEIETVVGYIKNQKQVS